MTADRRPYSTTTIGRTGRLGALHRTSSPQCAARVLVRSRAALLVWWEGGGGAGCGRAGGWPAPLCRGGCEIEGPSLTERGGFDTRPPPACRTAHPPHPLTRTRSHFRDPPQQNGLVPGSDPPPGHPPTNRAGGWTHNVPPTAAGAEPVATTHPPVRETTPAVSAGWGEGGGRWYGAYRTGTGSVVAVLSLAAIRCEWC